MRAVIAAMAGLMCTTSAFAQSTSYQGGAFSRPEAIIGVGLTIPFGGTRHQEAPRVELRMARDTVNFDGSRQSSVTPYQLETRIGISLEGDHKLTLNGRTIDRSRRQGISTLGLVAIGIGVVAIGAVVAVNEALDAASE